nr:pogo transposable element with znf domain [Quercus suber]
MTSNEGAVVLAMSAFRSGQFKSVRATAQAYNISKTTLLRRINGHPSKEDYTPENKRLSLVEEEAIIQWILRLDNQGLCPTVAIVKQMADSICTARGSQPVGKNWTTNFVRRTPALKIRINRVYDCQRKQCEDIQLIQEWFQLVRNTVTQHGIVPADIYNFDETGFQMGQIATSRVVTSAERQGKPKQIRPTGAEWVTLIQGASADGYIVPPFLIFKGKEYNRAWFNNLPSDWLIGVSPNGWTSDQLGLQWIYHFEKHTKARTQGSKRLLILDNHSSHETIEFISFCEDHNIILLWMPPHSSHILQPLDVGCFGPLKRSFSKHNQALIKNHIFHIQRTDFITTFYTSFIESITPANIKGGFRGSGIYPFNPEVVLSTLDPLPQPLSQPSSQGSWQPHTPKTSREVNQQTTLINSRLQNHIDSSPTPILEAINQLSKGAQIMATSAALLQTQVQDLQHVNKAFHIRKKRKKVPFRSEQPLTVEQVQSMPVEVVSNEVTEGTTKPARKPPTCTMCGTEGHTRRSCKQPLPTIS